MEIIDNELYYNGVHWTLARRRAYGSIEEQQDMQYWDSINGTTNWKDHISQVKSDYPKPS